MLEISFHRGTLELRNLPEHATEWAEAEGVLWDERARCHRARAAAYAGIVRALVSNEVPFRDLAKRYEPLDLPTHHLKEPRPYQTEALEAWLRAKGRGVVVLPTGSGKTQVALMAIAAKKRPTLVVAPTLELVRQWHALLSSTFETEVGLLGGGSHDVRPLTVTTYDSAHLHVDRLGSTFGMIVFDECHHLPSESYAASADGSLAPFRLGLSATPERADGSEARYLTLIGPQVYRKDITELAGSYLADYDTTKIMVELDPEERASYTEARQTYLAFVGKHGIQMGSPRGFQEFLSRSSRTTEGREAMRAYRRQREISFAPRSKIALLGKLLDQHRDRRTIIFTTDNRTAYGIARLFLLPIITHQTKLAERIDILARFRGGDYGAIVTARVLNEGVDVPEADVAVIVSGSGSVREHVQRLGRVLRKTPGKHAVLYELVTAKTGEESTSLRRREHDAYR
ncbi:MAG: DEAD/DEAH box helicase [Polyangiaceae bacterium]